MRRWFEFQKEFLNALVTGDGVYSNAYFARIQESLTDDFPGFMETLSEERWESLTHAFACTLPSVSWTLSEVSEGFLAFLSKQGEWSEEQIKKAKRDLAQVKSALLIRKPASFDLEQLPHSELILNPTLLPTGNENEWVRETVRGTELLMLSPDYSGLLRRLMAIRPLTIHAVLEQQSLFSLPSLEQLFHDWVKDEIFIGSRILKENL